MEGCLLYHSFLIGSQPFLVLSSCGGGSVSLGFFLILIRCSTFMYCCCVVCKLQGCNKKERRILYRIEYTSTIRDTSKSWGVGQQYGTSYVASAASSDLVVKIVISTCLTEVLVRHWTNSCVDNVAISLPQ